MDKAVITKVTDSNDERIAYLKKQEARGFDRSAIYKRALDVLLEREAMLEAVCAG